MRRWGYFVHRHRWWVLALSIVSFVASIAGLANGGQPKNRSDYNVESVKAANLESQQLPSTALGSSFVVLFTNASLLETDPRFESAVDSALASLKADPRVTGIETPYQGGALASELVSTDRHSVAVHVGVKGDFSTARRDFGQFRAEVQSSTLSIATSGDVPLTYDFDHLLANGPDAIRATKAHALAHAWGDVDEATFERLVEAHAAKRRSAEAAEGLASFAQKRPARW